jgi:hypothetical protein
LAPATAAGTVVSVPSHVPASDLIWSKDVWAACPKANVEKDSRTAGSAICRIFTGKPSAI